MSNKSFCHCFSSLPVRCVVSSALPCLYVTTWTQSGSHQQTGGSGSLWCSRADRTGPLWSSRSWLDKVDRDNRKCILTIHLFIWLKPKKMHFSGITYKDIFRIFMRKMTKNNRLSFKVPLTSEYSWYLQWPLNHAEPYRHFATHLTSYRLRDVMINVSRNLQLGCNISRVAYDFLRVSIRRYVLYSRCVFSCRWNIENVFLATPMYLTLS